MQFSASIFFLLKYNIPEKHIMKSFLMIQFIFTILFSVSVRAQEKTIKLLPPQKEIGKPLMQVLNLRQSSRTFDKAPLSQQDLSNLLWAAFGINRPETGKRTAPSARNWQEIDVYVLTAEGAFLYDAKTHSLQQVITEDIRSMAGKQDFVGTAPLNLVYVADYTKTGDASQEDRQIYCSADAGFIAQNVYLYCASQNLSVVVRGMVDRDALSKKLNFKSGQKIILAQTVGYPATEKK